MPDFEPIVGRYLVGRHRGRGVSRACRGSRTGRAAVVPAHRGGGLAAISPCAERRGDHGALPRHRVRPAVSRALDAGRRLVAEEVPPHHAVLSRDDPRGVAQARAGTAGGDGLLDGRRDRAQGRGRISGRAHRHRGAGKLAPMRRGATTSCCTIRRSTAASLRRATPTGSTRRRARRKTGARIGGTTARAARAFIRATCTSTATTGTGARTSSASTPTAARSRC